MHLVLISINQSINHSIFVQRQIKSTSASKTDRCPAKENSRETEPFTNSGWCKSCKTKNFPQRSKRPRRPIWPWNSSKIKMLCSFSFLCFTGENLLPEPRMKLKQEVNNNMRSQFHWLPATVFLQPALFQHHHTGRQLPVVSDGLDSAHAAAPVFHPARQSPLSSAILPQQRRAWSRI